jgi:hypothetical protein
MGPHCAALLQLRQIEENSRSTIKGTAPNVCVYGLLLSVNVPRI